MIKIVLDNPPVVFFEGAAAEGAELGCRDLDLMRRVGGGGRSVTTSGWDTSGSGGPCGYTTVGYLDTNKVMVSVTALHSQLIKLQ